MTEKNNWGLAGGVNLAVFTAYGIDKYESLYGTMGDIGRFYSVSHRK